MDNDTLEGRDRRSVITQSHFSQWRGTSHRDGREITQSHSNSHRVEEKKVSVEIRTFSTFEDHNHDATQIEI